MMKIKKVVISVVSVLLGLVVLFGILRGITGSWNPKNWGDAEKDLSDYVLKSEYEELKSEYDEVNAKVLYALGEFDTYESNGDGTVMIIRQTGYIYSPDIVNRLEQSEWNVYLAVFDDISGVVDETDNIWNNQDKIAVISDNINYTLGNPHSSVAKPYTVGISDYFLISNDGDSVDKLKQYIIEHPFVFQYKLASSYSEKVMENQSIWR